MDPVHITVKEGAKPVRRMTARPLDLSIRQDAEKYISDLLKSGVIEECKKPTDWTAPSMFIRKASGGVRLVTDFRQLNKSVQRIGWPFPSSEAIRKSILPDSKCYFTLDCFQGYHQIPVREEDQDLLAFITPFGKYKYKRLPMGYSDSSDQFLMATDPIVAGVDRVDKSIDDVLGQCRSF